MQAVEEIFEEAVRDGTTPGAVLMAETCDGSFRYAKAFGVRSLKTQEPMELNTVMAIASCTKLLTAISILQLFQSGKLTPETDVLPRLPELAALPILTGFDDAGQPLLQDRKAPTISVRQLLTHSMGGSYHFISPRLQRYYGGNPPSMATVIQMAGLPMIAEPDQIWSYSHGNDWAGLLLERVLNTDLDSYMRENLWDPIGLTEDEIGFWPNKHPGLTSKKADVAIRKDPKGSVSHATGSFTHDTGTDAFGGGGCFATMPAFMKILRSVIDPKDERLLNSQWKEQLFKPQINKKVEISLNKILRDPIMGAGFVGEFPTSGVRFSWGYGGLLSLDDDPGWRNENTLLWSGLYNLLWYIDRKAGLCVLYGGQVLPAGDEKVKTLISTFEKGIYAELGARKSKSRL